MSKNLTVALVAAAVGLVAGVALVGCNKSEPGGGAGTDTFTVSAPTMSTDVKQGEVQTATLTVKRGEGFKLAVKLEVKAPDGSGLKIDPDNSTVKPGDKGEVQLKITAAKDAPLGVVKILVKGTPDKGEPATNEFKVTVSAK